MSFKCIKSIVLYTSIILIIWLFSCRVCNTSADANVMWFGNNGLGLTII